MRIRSAGDARGLGLVEVLVVLVIVAALAGFVLHRYVGQTARTVERVQEERPLARARLTADLASLEAVRAPLRVYHAEHGRWPPDRAGVLALLPAPPRFLCPGNDFDYDPATGGVRLTITDPARC